MCENWNSSKELRVRKMIFSLSFWFRGRVSGSVSALSSTRIGFSRFWGQISMIGAQNMTHQRVMNLWKATIMLKDYLLGLYRKKIIGKAYFNTKHLPPKTGIFLKEHVFTPSFLRFHVSNFHWLPHGSDHTPGRSPGTPDTTGTAPALNLKRRPNLYRERHCIWFSYPLELPGIIRSYESYVMSYFLKKLLEGHSVSIRYDWGPEEIHESESLTSPSKRRAS